MINDEYILELLSEAMELLDEGKHQMALFRHQRYCELRATINYKTSANPSRKDWRKLVMVKKNKESKPFTPIFSNLSMNGSKPYTNIT